MVGSSSVAYRNTAKRTATGKKQGDTYKGLIKKIRVGRRKGADTRELERQAFTVPIYRCAVCAVCYYYESNLIQHHEREHKERKKHTRLATLRKGYFCKACGDRSR